MMKNLCILAGIALLISGCGKDVSEKLAEKAIESQIEKDGGKAKVDLAKNQITMQTKDGEEVHMDGSGKGKLPADFPKDVFTPEGAGVLTSMKKNKDYMLVMETKEPADKLVEKCKVKMTKDGWNEASVQSVGGSTVLEYEKEPRKATFNISGDKDQVQFMVNVATDESSEEKK